MVGSAAVSDKKNEENQKSPSKGAMADVIKKLVAEGKRHFDV